jgi:hypothetical protein
MYTHWNLTTHSHILHRHSNTQTHNVHTHTYWCHKHTLKHTYIHTLHMLLLFAVYYLCVITFIEHSNIDLVPLHIDSVLVPCVFSQVIVTHCIYSLCYYFFKINLSALLEGPLSMSLLVYTCCLQSIWQINFGLKSLYYINTTNLLVFLDYLQVNTTACGGNERSRTRCVVVLHKERRL